MAESVIQVNSGNGPKDHTWNRTIGANSIEDPFVILGEQPYATYSVSSGGVATTTSAAHALQIMAGGTLNVYIRKIYINQGAAAGAAGAIGLTIVRLTTAGTGGGAVTPAPLDASDAAAGAAGMTLPTVKGTEGTVLYNFNIPLLVAPVATPYVLWEKAPTAKGIRIPAGTTNGIAFKWGTGVATSTVLFNVEIVELNY